MSAAGVGRGLQLLDRISASFDSLSKQHKRIAAFILSHSREAASMPLRLLSERTGVSQATVVRFAYALGCSGYPGLIEELRANLPNRLTTVERLNMMDGLSSQEVIASSFATDISNLQATAGHNSPVLIDAAVHAMDAARRLYLVGSRSSRPLIEFLDYYLRYMMDNVRNVRFDGSDLYAQLLRMDARDCVLAVSFPRYSVQTLGLLEQAQDSGAVIVTITDSHTSPPALLSDYTLTARSYMNSFVDSFVAPLALINVLIIKLGLRRRAQLFANFEQLEELWNRNSVYASKKHHVEGSL